MLVKLLLVLCAPFRALRQNTFVYGKPTNALVIIHVFCYPQLHVSVAFCDHHQDVEYKGKSTIKSCVYKFFQVLVS